jgi:molybdate transport system ATP-binding protein
MSANRLEAAGAGLVVDGNVTRGSFTLRIALRAEPGEVLAVLGPNGAGKSTTLRAVAGLLPLDEGRVELDGRVLDGPGCYLPPQERHIGIVFQDHRLFPHLRVLDNVAFGARARGIRAAAARTMARDWLARLGIAELARRRPRELSGGQAQRVALARALASEPAALLLDEPLAALDVQTRAEVQGELHRHLAAYPGPTLLVSHDPVEALLLARRLVVLENGQVVQQGTTADITTRPRTPYVARLVGLNLFTGTAHHGVVDLEGGGAMPVPDAPDGRLLVAIRPSAFTVHTSHPENLSARIVLVARVGSLAPIGDRVRLVAHADREVLVDVTPTAVAELDLVPGRTIWLSAKATDVLAYPGS